MMKKANNKFLSLISVVLIICTLFSVSVLAAGGYTALKTPQTIYLSADETIYSENGDELGTMPAGKENTALMYGYTDDKVYVEYLSFAGYISNANVIVLAGEYETTTQAPEPDIADKIVEIGGEILGDKIPEIQEGIVGATNEGYSLLEALDEFLVKIKDFFGNLINTFLGVFFEK